jgi:hypothetical protein
MSEPDPLLPAQRIYANAVVAAERKYRTACHEAWEERAKDVDEAVRICVEAMREEIVR